MSRPRRTRRRATASSGGVRRLGTVTRRPTARASHEPPRSDGLARTSASAAWLPRRAWHHSAAMIAPLACAHSTTVSMPSASRTCRDGGVQAGQVLPQFLGVAFRGGAARIPQPAQVRDVEVEPALGVPAGQVRGHERVGHAVQVDHRPLGGAGAAPAEHRPVQAGVPDGSSMSSGSVTASYPSAAPCTSVMRPIARSPVPRQPGPRLAPALPRIRNVTTQFGIVISPAPAKHAARPHRWLRVCRHRGEFGPAASAGPPLARRRAGS